MDFEAFSEHLRLAHGAPPVEAGPPLCALWHVRRGEWERAHAIVQAQDDVACAWVHAHLHRVEGDLPNARYWYTRAGRLENDAPIMDEWTTIVTSLTDALPQ
jgi:hypothetical protein